MRPAEGKSSRNYGPTKEISSSSAINFESHKGNGINQGSRHRMALGKPTPSKWDDAQKWLVGLSRGGDRSHAKTKPRNSNADDRRLIAPAPRKEKDSSSSAEEEGGEDGIPDPVNVIQDEGEMKKMDCSESFWRINKPSADSSSGIRSICVRDMGTEMTPIASQEPSRTGTPLRATTPAARSPISSRSSTPGRCYQGSQALDTHETGHTMESRNDARADGATRFPNREEVGECNAEEARKSNPLEIRAMAWDEAERAKYIARYKREDVRIQAWENHEKRKAEKHTRRMEVFPTLILITSIPSHHCYNGGINGSSSDI
uniref:Remorin C-terminal domain-containing protein n=1 Tax=Nelumbo nucifera TaxID=4432 RepID=A0A822YP58_NELNU|nr:TPA_asm: hypothetical protein HUJ06_004947 [Nelumbo nucifera]